MNMKIFVKVSHFLHPFMALFISLSPWHWLKIYGSLHGNFLNLVIWPDEHCPITTQLAWVIISILQTFLVMHKSCKGNHLHLFHPDRLQPESLTCLIYFCCSQLSKMLDWSSVTFGSWLKKKDDKTWCNVNSNYEICICPWKAFQEYVWNERSELNFSNFLFWQLFIPLAYQFYILNYMIFHTISSYVSYSTVGF